MKGILLAAGKGNRLYPLTTHTPKPLLNVAGKPILSWIIEGLRDVGVTDLAIVVGHLAKQIKDYYGNGNTIGVNIEYYHQTTHKGTAGAVLPAENFLRNAPFFLGYGDILVEKSNYDRLLRLHSLNPMDSIIAGWPSDTPWTGGVLKVNTENKLVGLIEKPHREQLQEQLHQEQLQEQLQGQAITENATCLINAGLMIFQPEIIQYIQKVKISLRGEYELTDAIVDFAEKSQIHVMNLQSFWSDIGTHDKLKEADRHFSQNRIS